MGLKINKKTYTVKDIYGTLYRIDKISLFGLPKYLYDEAGVTEKMKVGCYVSIEKSIKT